MEITMNEDKKMAAVWLTNADQKDPALREQLKAFYKECKAKDILAVEYQSGTGDLFQNTLALLSYNRKRSAEKELQIQPPKPKKHRELER